MPPRRPGSSSSCQAVRRTTSPTPRCNPLRSLDEPPGINEALLKRASRANVTKNLAMRASSIAPGRNFRQHDPRSNDVRYCSPRFCDRSLNDFKATDRLPVNITWSRGASRRCNRCRPATTMNWPTRTTRLKPISGSSNGPDEMNFLGTTPTSAGVKAAH